MLDVSSGSLLLKKSEVAKLLGQTERTIQNMVSDGRLFPPIEFSHINRRWRRHDLEQWVGRGCPHFEMWNPYEDASSAQQLIGESKQ